jgi:hypothetical protein
MAHELWVHVANWGEYLASHRGFAAAQEEVDLASRRGFVAAQEK